MREYPRSLFAVRTLGVLASTNRLLETSSSRLARVRHLEHHRERHLISSLPGTAPAAIGVPSMARVRCPVICSPVNKHRLQPTAIFPSTCHLLSPRCSLPLRLPILYHHRDTLSTTSPTQAQAIRRRIHHRPLLDSNRLDRPPFSITTSAIAHCTSNHQQSSHR